MPKTHEVSLDAIAQYIAPSLIAVAAFLGPLQLFPPMSQPKAELAAKALGLALPALWLTSIGPRGLMRGGGFLMRLLGIKNPSHMKITLFGLVWLALYLMCYMVIKTGVLLGAVVEYVVLGFGYAGIMSGLGVFVFLAVEKSK